MEGNMKKRRDMPTTVYVSLRRIICVRSRTVSLSRNAGFRKNLKSRFSSQGAFLHRVREISFFLRKSPAAGIQESADTVFNVRADDPAMLTGL